MFYGNKLSIMGYHPPPRRRNIPTNIPETRSSHRDKVKLSVKNALVFPYFTNLPPDIQERIWGFVEVEPAIIHVHSAAGASRKIPGVLHACRASRAEFLVDENKPKKHPVYEVFPGIAKIRPERVLICREIDTVLPFTTHFFKGATNFNVRHLALSFSQTDSYMKHLPKLPHLKSLTVIESWVRALDQDDLREWNGEVVNCLTSRIGCLTRHQEWTEKEIEELEKLHPGWVAPVVKFRHLDHFTKNPGSTPRIVEALCVKKA